MPRSRLAMPVVALCLALAACTRTHPSRDKERDAVRLLGDVQLFESGGVRIDADCPLIDGVERRQRASDIVRFWLQLDNEGHALAPNIGDSMHVAARRLAEAARGCRKMELWIPTRGMPDSSAVIAILGAPNRRMSKLVSDTLGQDVSSWHESAFDYGWLTFTAISAKVAYLDVDAMASGH